MVSKIALVGVVLLGLARTCDASEAERPLTIKLDGPELVPRRQTVTKDTTCADDGKCVDKRDLALECRNGVSVQASIVQPRLARATLTSMTYRGKPLREETLHTVNLLLGDRPSTAVIEIEGICGPYEAAVYINAFADAYLKTRHQEGATIIVSLTTDGQESVQVGPSQ
jgi:hypothetical protein